MAGEANIEDSSLTDGGIGGGSFSTSANSADSEPAVASRDNWGLFSTSSNPADSEPAVASGGDWGLFRTSSNPADSTPAVASCSSIEYCLVDAMMPYPLLPAELCPYNS